MTISENLKGLHDRFWSKVQIMAGDACWPWLGSRNQKGYGQFSIDGHLYPAHKIAFLLSGHLVPEGYQVLHSCDNPPCCNPAHARAGTAQDNSDDAKVRGRLGKHAKVTHAQALTITARVLSGESCRTVAEDFGIHFTQVSRISRRYRDSVSFEAVS